MKKSVIVALAVLLSGTSASLASTHRPPTHHHRIYNYVPSAPSAKAPHTKTPTAKKAIPVR